MAKFTIGTVTRCSGNNHVRVPVTREGGGTATVMYAISDFTEDITDNDISMIAGLHVLRHLGKAAGAVTFAQWKTAIEGKDIYI